ncbi:hypothetical protein Btus_1148 [Kyrpidia tusciae DSM 2912]|uniref:Uncharacterized protein n=1 Tax=Kyrpidia tusciae (strain DSM 2912 / NBRC 15312 / T2) TaxID=562970 RepID=D5WXG2_KYRT2|nr:hypothetical protein Btus_1148 [Kyrpidia tusciae DSM 2912]
MNHWQLVLLGLIAGGTIYIGLPLGRLSGLNSKVRAILSMLSPPESWFICWWRFSVKRRGIQPAPSNLPLRGRGRRGARSPMSSC